MESNQIKLEDLAEKLSRAEQQVVDLNDSIRKVMSNSGNVHEIWGANSVMDEHPPWQTTLIHRHLPNMLSEEDGKYISWISKKIPENSSVLELGPWLGQSTQLLRENLNKSSSLDVVDDFIWRSAWMSPYVGDDLHHDDGSSFLSTFKRLNRNILNQIRIHEASIEQTAENKHIKRFDPPFKGGLEMVLVDCGRTFSLNETWWNLLKPHFIPNVTLIALQDFRTHREVPKQWWNQLDEWVKSKYHFLEQVHEVNSGGIASFVFKGFH